MKTIVEPANINNQLEDQTEEWNGATALWIASLKKYQPIVEYIHNVVNVLLDHNSNVNAIDEDEWTPLYLSCWNGHIELTSLLLEKGADPSLKTNENSNYKNNTLSMLAKERKHDEVAAVIESYERFAILRIDSLFR